MGGTKGCAYDETAQIVRAVGACPAAIAPTRGFRPTRDLRKLAGAACATRKAMTRTPRTAADIMNRDLVTLEETQNLMFLPEVMKLFRFRHMPVVDGNRLVGLVTERDILRVSASSLLPTAREQTDYLAKKFVVRDMMTRDVQTVHPETPLMEVAQRMRKDKLGCMPVVEGENTLVGIITEADFVTLSTRLLPTPT
jgi:CBS domain-containing protein